MAQGEIGLWYWRLSNETVCTNFPTDVGSGYIQTARVSSLVGICAAGLEMALLVLETFLVKLCCSGLFNSTLFSLALIGSGLTFFLYASTFCTTDLFFCSMAFGSNCMIATFALYLGASILECLMPIRDPLLKQCRDSRRGANNESHGEENKPDEGELHREELTPATAE